jgi:hypothetical protein
MSEPPPFDPDSPVHQGDIRAFTRRRTPLKRYLGPALAAAAITLVLMLLLAWIATFVVSGI